MVQVADVEVLRVIPVVRLLEQELRDAQIQEPQQNGGGGNRQAEPLPARFRGRAGRAVRAHFFSASARRNCCSTESAVITCRHTLSVQGVLRWLVALTQGEHASPA